MEKYGCSEDHVVAGMFVSRFVQDGLRVKKDVRELAVISFVLESFLQSLEATGVGIDNQISLLEVTRTVADKIEYYIVHQERLHVPKEVILVNVVDIYIKPFFEIYQDVTPNVDLRWVMTELLGALERDFPSKHIEQIKKLFKETTLEPSNYFSAASLVICRFYEEYWLKQKDEQSLARYGDIGFPKFVGCITHYINDQSGQIMTPLDYFATFTDSEDSRKASENQITRAFTNLSAINRPPILMESSFRWRFARTRLFIEDPSGKKYDRTVILVSELSKEKDGEDIEGVLAVVTETEDLSMAFLIDGLIVRRNDISALIAYPEVSKIYPSLGLVDTEKTLIFNAVKDIAEMASIDNIRDNLGKVIGVCEQTFEKNRISLASDRSQTSVITQVIEHPLNMVQNELSLILNQLVPPDCSATLVPAEYLFEDEAGTRLTMTFSSDDTRAVGIITLHTVSMPYTSHKRRVIQSKTKQVVSERKIQSKTLRAAIEKKMSEMLGTDPWSHRKLTGNFRWESEATKDEVAEATALEVAEQIESKRDEYFLRIWDTIDRVLSLELTRSFWAAAGKKGFIDEKTAKLKSGGLENIINETWDSLRLPKGMTEEIGRPGRLLVEDLVQEFQGSLLSRIDTIDTIKNRLRKIDPEILDWLIAEDQSTD